MSESSIPSHQARTTDLLTTLFGLGREVPGRFTETDEAILCQFGAHVAVAIENARFFEKEREHTSMLETLSDVAREFGSILNLEELLTRIANLTRRVIPLGSFPGSSYNEAAFVLSSGDLYVFFTDGVSEAQDALGGNSGSCGCCR